MTAALASDLTARLESLGFSGVFERTTAQGRDRVIVSRDRSTSPSLPLQVDVFRRGEHLPAVQLESSDSALEVVSLLS